MLTTTTSLWRRVVLAALAIGGLALAWPAGAASAASAPDRIPAGFVPSSTSWSSATHGWLLGFAPCPSGSCPALFVTFDAGATWRARTAPPVAVSPVADQVRVLFGSATDGVVSDGTQLFATHDAGAHWRSAPLAGAASPTAIVTMTASRDRLFAVVIAGSGDATTTGLFSSPLGATRWAAVPGVSIPGVQAASGWDVTARGTAVEVALGAIFQSSRYWVSPDGRRFTEQAAPCPVEATTRLSEPVLGTVLALCSSNPGRGLMSKELLVSVNGRPFADRGPAPDPGITLGMAAATPTTAAVSAVGQGASFVHATFDGGATWETPVTLVPDMPLYDLAFQDARHGVFVRGGPNWPAAEVYRTVDGGHTWTLLPLG